MPYRNLKKRKKYDVEYRRRNKEKLNTLRRLRDRRKRREDLWYFIQCLCKTTKRQHPGSNLNSKYLLRLWNKQKGVCPLTGIAMTLSDGSYSNPTKGSIDQIKIGKGHVKGNVRFLAVWANRARHMLDDREFVNLCASVVKYRRRRRSNGSSQ